jgi:hypothetical protein
MNKTIILGAIIPLFLLLSTNCVFALSDQGHYEIGWQSGVSQSQYDWDNNVPYEPFCPGHHSNSFCLGFQEGYDPWWKSARQLSNQQITQGTEQNTAVNIPGNGNHVTVNQQSNNNAGSSEDDGQGGRDGANPRCTFLCANVQIK